MVRDLARTAWMNGHRNNAPADERRQTATAGNWRGGRPAGSACAARAVYAAAPQDYGGRIDAMSRKLRVLALVTVGAAVLYAAGTAVMLLAPWPWVWLVPLAVLAAALLRLVERPAERRALRRAWGRCERCEYDLRATPWRCPECGRTPGDDVTARGGRFDF
jgi:hypothetical protein